MKPEKTTIGPVLADEIGQPNAHALESVATAYRAMLSLINAGCTISGVITGWRNPVIQLGGTPPKGILSGAMRCRRIAREGVITIYAAHYMGAQIEWREHKCH